MRLAILADIHGNLPALEAVLGDLATRTVDAVINLGDCVSGPLWPRDTFARLHGLGWPTVRGNHDRWVATMAPGDLSDTDAFTRSDLSETAQRWLGALPARITLADEIAAFHACPDDDDAYLTETVIDGRLVPAPRHTVAARLGSLQADIVLAAHSHLATVVRLPGGPWIVNPGSVGCPAYADSTEPAHVSESGSPLARYAILTRHEPDSEPAVELLGVPYDHRTAARRAASLGRGDWAAALTTGFIGAE